MEKDLELRKQITQLEQLVESRTAALAETQARLLAKPSDTVRPVVFYDGDCPLCRREIAHYRRMDSANKLHWVDAVNEPEILAEMTKPMIGHRSAEFESLMSVLFPDLGHFGLKKSLDQIRVSAGQKNFRPLRSPFDFHDIG